MTEAVTRTATQDGTAKNQAGLLWAMKKSEPSNPSLFASHIGQHNPVTLRPRRQNADTSATAKTTVYFSVDRRPPPPQHHLLWLWIPGGAREGHGQLRALCLSFPVCTVTCQAVVLKTNL